MPFYIALENATVSYYSFRLRGGSPLTHPYPNARMITEDLSRENFKVFISYVNVAHKLQFEIPFSVSSPSVPDRYL